MTIDSQHVEAILTNFVPNFENWGKYDATKIMEAVAPVTIRTLGPAGQLPSYETEGAAGADLKANHDLSIEPGTHGIVDTGIKVQIPKGFEIQIRSRSGLAAKHGVMVLNSPGTIDSDYRGSVMVILANFGTKKFQVNKGDRIAQMIVAPVIRGNFIMAENLDETVRAQGGLGSTGVA